MPTFNADIAILKVTQVKSYSQELKQLNKRWKKFAMQIIETDDGIFVDHKEGEKIGYWAGVNYESIIGQEYEFSHIVDNWNSKWTERSSNTEGNHPWMKPL